jgi:DNA-binding PadR family transcriptional regulator
MNNDAVLEQTQNLVQELRRGVIVLAVLSQLEEEQYGYSLMKKLEDQGMLIDQGTLYPLLRRLEEQGILASDWRVETSRPRRYYIMSDFGKQVLTEMSSEWNRIKTTIDKLLENIKGEKDETD